jgi:hypothetical protein
MPILNYSSEILGFTNDISIERVNLQFCKSILGVKKTTQNDFVYGELGRTSLQVIHHMNIVKYWVKILRTRENKYIYLIYNMLKLDFERDERKVNWCSMVKNLLCSLGFYDAWLEQNVGDVELFLSSVKQRLTDQFIQNWHSRLNDSSRALFYRNIASFQSQPYLECFSMNKFCQALSRLRVSSHRLQIESGRWARPVRIEINERKCNLCGLLEDEFHFVIECYLYNDLRKKYIPRYYWNRPNMFKFLELIKSDNKTVIRNLGIYVYNAFAIRNNVMYGQ